MDILQDRVNEYRSVLIRLASPEEIRQWSHGEVKKPETVNYRTFKPEKDGLFCERIFGPEKDHECSCGKFRGTKYKGLVCDRCGVEITSSRVRRKRMGHITLAAPVVHIWFLKVVPSRIGAVLGMRLTDLEQITYYQRYVVTEVRDRKIRHPQANRELREGKDVLTEEQYRDLKERHRDGFEADMGGRALQTLLGRTNLRHLADELRAEIGRTSPASQKQKDLVKRLRTVESLLESGNRPEWMVLTILPVIPPELRPLVMLESGTFATSDLNDLYRRLINRNNRLKRLLDLNAPEVIVRNEKRMLQQAADALFDNGRCRRPVLGANNRPLKSLADIIQGKQGRFRENLLGKRVDYSARSVIVVGPELRLHQCGLPKKIALELFQPFVIRRIKEMGRAETIKNAKKMIDRQDPIVWDVLDEVIKDHPVLLNRAPTLHRMGIQAFQPVLTDSRAIQLHPMVCPPFNADFDGDQMAVHLPLSYEAQVEAKTLMMSTQNVFSPAHGNPIISPTQDMILGLYYLTVLREGQPGEGKVFHSFQEAILAHEMGRVSLHARITVRAPKGRTILERQGSVAPPQGRFETTVGRILFNEILPPGMPYYNMLINKKLAGTVISDAYRISSKNQMLALLDDMKALGFRYATLSGLSIAKDDLRQPAEREKIVQEAQKEVERVERSYQQGLITAGERYLQIIGIWTIARDRVTDRLMEGLRADTRDRRPYLNPIYVMVDSGARGSQDQVRQLAGMRGLMAKPSGRIIETPILSNFREGLTVMEYFSSTHGARKGLADTALKTSDAGYLTRKLVDVAQSWVVTQVDCGTIRGIKKKAIYKGDVIEVPLSQAIYGRVALKTIVDLETDTTIVREGDLNTREIAEAIEHKGYSAILVRSPLTCEARSGVCAKCYGMDLSTGQLVELGLAVGVIAAQSIGEPGTQLTMRTFHIGGIAVAKTEEPKHFAKSAGVARFENAKVVRNRQGAHVVVNRNAFLLITDAKGRELERYELPTGATLKVEDGREVKPRTLLAQWDPHNIPIISAREGRVQFSDIIKGETLAEERDRSGAVRRYIMEHKGHVHPQIIIRDLAAGSPLEAHPLPERAYLEVQDGAHVYPGTILAKTPREISGTQDITGGLPRVTDLFEARRPKDAAIIAEVDGTVEIGEVARGRRKVTIRAEGLQRPLVVHIPVGRHLRVQTGDRVRAGDPLTEGPLVPHEMLRIKGEEAVQEYLLNEIQAVYRSQNVTINDKHIEIIIAAMMRKVRIRDPGDTSFLPQVVVDRWRIIDENERLRKERGATFRAATFRPLLLGITKAAIQSESFIAAASFQETAKVLTEAATAGRRDHLIGLKENVIVGHLIPAGTGFKHYLDMRLRREEPPVEEPALPVA